MSANNQLLIFKIKDYYYVFMDYCIDNDFELPNEEHLKDWLKEALFKTRSKTKAIDFCEKLCQEEIVEYGWRLLT